MFISPQRRNTTRVVGMKKGKKNIDKKRFRYSLKWKSPFWVVVHLKKKVKEDSHAVDIEQILQILQLLDYSFYSVRARTCVSRIHTAEKDS